MADPADRGGPPAANPTDLQVAGVYRWHFQAQTRTAYKLACGKWHQVRLDFSVIRMSLLDLTLGCLLNCME
ncbi:hypothetical protein Y1Q_0000331 [Alligator mississippiensis]|uniref:Uncharacterized protein n=1 Tax=Alligator mississippiensis TaxID=8496 RepID=A0A151LZC9_ALLMI|nr:hypothetical protein Y1Q_0000331 [Alligator mississippiensis]